MIRKEPEVYKSDKMFRQHEVYDAHHFNMVTFWLDEIPNKNFSFLFVSATNRMNTSKLMGHNFTETQQFPLHENIWKDKNIEICSSTEILNAPVGLNIRDSCSEHR
jgi:hypothetical protein